MDALEAEKASLRFWNMVAIGWVKYGWAISMALWMAGGASLIAVYGTFASAGALFLVAYGAFSVAGVLGFMLGIKPVKDGIGQTHLQEVSDWLTKLLLGAGLVELKSLGKYAWRFSGELGGMIGERLGQDSLGRFAVLAILTGFSALGILTGYLWSQYHYGNN